MTRKVLYKDGTFVRALKCASTEWKNDFLFVETEDGRHIEISKLAVIVVKDLFPGVQE